VTDPGTAVRKDDEKVLDSTPINTGANPATEVVTDDKVAVLADATPAKVATPA